MSCILQTYAVYDSGTHTSGVMFLGTDGNNASGVWFKASGSTTLTCFDDAAILGAVADNNGSVGVVYRLGDGTLKWNDGTGTIQVYARTVSDEISNFCAVNSTTTHGFYFSTWNSNDGANLWFADTVSGTFVLHAPFPMAPSPLCGTPYWHSDTRISWITAVPGNGQGYDVMFSGDRCTQDRMYTDGRQLWGATGPNTPVEIHDTSSDVPPWCYNNPAQPPYYNQCPWWMVTSKINVAVDGKLYFSDYASNSLGELWVSDGTTTTCIYDNESFDWGDNEAPFKPIAGMQGYLYGDEPRVFFYLDSSTPSDLWVTDGSSVYAIAGGFDLDYCAGPKIPGQQAAHNPFVVVTDPQDTDYYGTAYFTAGTYDENGTCRYRLYQIAPGDDISALSASPLWTWGSGPSGPAQDWLTIGETPVGGGVDNHTLYFKGDNLSPNQRNRKTFSYDPGSGVITAASTPNYDPSWLVYDLNPYSGVGTLYYFSFSGTTMMDQTEYLCWW